MSCVMAMDKWLLLTCTALLVSHSALVEATPCVLDGFDLSELTQATYWNVTVAKENCLVPKGYSEKNITGCTVHFSVCKPLPRTVCVNHTNSSTCQVVKTKDRKIHYFNIGDYEPSNELQPTGGSDDIGFATIRQGDTIDSASCNDTYDTIITWKCEPATRWDHLKTNVTLLAEFSIDSCVLELSFNYSGACYVPPTLPPKKCRLDPYDLTGLEIEDYWFTTLPNTSCLAANSSSCNIYFSFCQALPLSIGEGCYGAAVCQAGMDSQGSFSYSMGQLNEHTRFIEGVGLVGGGFYLDVDSGDSPGCQGDNNRISTRVVLSCNPTAHWRGRNLSSVAHVSQQGCQYTIMLPYAGACLRPTPSVTHSPTATPSSPSSTHVTNSTKLPRPTATKSTATLTSTKTTSGQTSTTKEHTPTNTPVPTNKPTTGPPGHPTTPEHHTSPRHHTTTEHPPNPTANPDSQKIAGLTAGLVIFVIISVVLLVLFIITAWFAYKYRSHGDYQKLEDKM